MAAAEVYAEQLNRLNYGYPLWHPEPPNDADEIHVGDVGFVRDGAFYRMFNALVPGDSPINGGHVPPDYAPFVFKTDRSFINIRNAINKGALSSKTIEKIAIRGSAGESSHHVGAGFKFQCKSDQGAVLVMNHGADLEAVHGSSSLVKYLEENWEVWRTYISSDAGLDIEIPRRPGLMFVSGVHRTVDWAVASYVSGGRSAEFSLSADAVAASGAFSLAVSSRTDIAPIHNWGPRGREGIRPAASTANLEGVKKDQSVFINYYAMKRRLKVLNSIIMKAAAGYHDLPPPDRDAESECALSDVSQAQSVGELETSASAYQYNDPVNTALDYILEKDARVQVALACDRDIGELCSYHGHEFPDDPSEFLSSLKPSVEILEGGVGILSNGAIHMDLLTSEDEVQETRTISTGNSETVASPEHADTNVKMPQPGSMDDEPRNSAATDSPLQNKQMGPFIRLEHRREGDEAGSNAVGINAIAYSPDGRYLASGGEDALIIIWDTQAGARLKQYNGHSYPICSLAFSPNSQRLVSGSNDGLVIVWSVETGQTLMTLEKHSEPVCSIAYSSDGAFIATGSFDQSIGLWDAETGEQHDLSDGSSDVVLFVGFSPDSRQLVSTTADYCARIWDVKSDQLLHLLEGHHGIINTVAYAPDGRRLATGSEDGGVRIWSAESGAMLVDLREHTEPVWALGFSADGQRLLSAANDGSIKVCDSYGAEKLHDIDVGEGLVTAVAFSPDGTRICAAGNDIRVWDAGSGALLKTLPTQMEQVSQLRFSPDAEHVVSSSDDGVLHVWSIDEYMDTEVAVTAAM